MVRCECVKFEATVGYSSPNAGEWEAVRKVGLDLSSKDGSVYRNVGLHLGESPELFIQQGIKCLLCAPLKCWACCGEQGRQDPYATGAGGESRRASNK